MYRQSSSDDTRQASDYGLAGGLVDVLADLFDATSNDELPRSLRLAGVWLRRHASSGEGLAHCGDELIEGLADIAAEARREPADPFVVSGVRLAVSTPARSLS